MVVGDRMALEGLSNRASSNNHLSSRGREEEAAAAEEEEAKEEEEGYPAKPLHHAFSSINRSRIHLLSLIIFLFLAMLFLIFLFPLSITTLPPPQFASSSIASPASGHKYLYWGDQIDCPGKHCSRCAGLGHQESSLRCALEEAFFLNRTFIMPSRMCISPLHNGRDESRKGPLDLRWDMESYPMDFLYDLSLLSRKVRVILNSSSEWSFVLSMAQHLRSILHVQNIDRLELQQNHLHNDAIVINRTASSLSWFVECTNRKNHSTLLLPNSFLPSMAAKPLRLAAEQIRKLLGDYDGIHVRRGDKLKVRKDRFGVNRTLHPHLDRDTQPEAIMQRISNWIPEGRTIFLASNEKRPGFFNPLTSRYKVAYYSNFTNILNPVVQNNYQLFMVERLVLMGAKTFVKTFKEEPSDLSLTDDGKKRIRAWEIPVYTFDRSSS